MESTHYTIFNTAVIYRFYECFGQLFIGFFSQCNEQEKARAYCMIKEVVKLDQKVSCPSYY